MSSASIDAGVSSPDVRMLFGRSHTSLGTLPAVSSTRGFPLLCRHSVQDLPLHYHLILCHDELPHLSPAQISRRVVAIEWKSVFMPGTRGQNLGPCKRE
jgi:hypothetical protein